jgi:hypothetical protein
MASRRALGYAAVGVLVAGGTGWLVLNRPEAAKPVAAQGVGSAPVVRTTVTAHDIVTGSLGYLGPVTVVAGTGPGVLTWLPAPGTTIGTDQRLYEVDGRPVLLWQGDRPAWRDLVPGMPAGPDVTQAERNLAALGYGGHLTGTAVRRWQAAHGLPRTGVIALGQVVFEPGPARIATVPASLGTPVHPGLEVLTATSTTKAVSVSLDPNRQSTVHVGDPVMVTLPTLRTAPGRVLAVGAPVGATLGTSAAAGGAASNGTVGVPVTVALDDAGAANGMDGGTVQVAIITARHDNVLAVPVDALLAAPGGGYQVAVTSGGQRRLVTVHCGLFDETGGLVEVSGDVSPGMTVEVPAP